MSRHRNLPLYSIGAVSNLTGLSERRIRYYEQAGLVRPARTAGNQRRYSQADVERLLEIKGLLQQGLHLDDIRRRLLERRRREAIMGPPDVPVALAAVAADPWPLPVSGRGGRGAEPGLPRIDRLFRGPAPAVPGVGTARTLYPALDPAVLYQARRHQRPRDGRPWDRLPRPGRDARDARDGKEGGAGGDGLRSPQGPGRRGTPGEGAGHDGPAAG
ncbi:transcriptional regulator, MerR family [Thermaerobacter marianensis DSM 12885]|uniref:Transcriptional regulator, MerR family n=1 Tax=Thermaerobacter marianensis (strain ATCC 700841 / DSM 12885 / JCM 10246 / 7p75a) TaxID=644966 RepID=E6SGM8_THEM7|nr:MerR family transcriptional regulator [Thermaerobacter marianensis]ADU50574.1 transcriptional regulator, MerR family [Thermaerobacter marianensis DSM 12885]